MTSTGAPGTTGRREEARQIVELLLRYGADPAIANKRGKTPRDYATDPDLAPLLTQ